MVWLTSGARLARRSSTLARVTGYDINNFKVETPANHSPALLPASSGNVIPATLGTSPCTSMDTQPTAWDLEHRQHVT